jgi:hypothetical protein
MSLSSLILCIEFTWVYKFYDKLLTGFSWLRIDYSGVFVKKERHEISGFIKFGKFLY